MHWSFVNCISEEEITKLWDKEKPLVTIVCVTYNHGLYIKDAINGFLAQKSSYPFEIVIYDDASNDNAQQIINFYYNQYPNLIKPILQKENQWLGKGINGTIKFAYPAAKGKYIALCEGDDYWTDPCKLQKQVDFLEKNSDFNICFTRVFKLLDQEIVELDFNNIKTEFTLNDLYKDFIPIITCSVLMRNFELPKWIKNINIVDIAIFTACSNKSKIKLLNEFTSVYRIHNNGIWQGATIEKQIRDRLQLYFTVFPYVNKEIKSIIKEQVEQVWLPDLVYLLTKDKSKYRKIFISFIVKITYFKLFIRFTFIK